MKITLNGANLVSVTGANFIQASEASQFIYIYGVASGKTVKVTYRKPNGNLIGPLTCVYDEDPDEVLCYIATIPSKALSIDGDVGVSIAVYSSGGVIETTPRATATILPNDSIEIPEELETLVTDDIYLHLNQAIADIADLEDDKADITYVDSEIADILDGTKPITNLDVNGDADISGNTEIHGNFIVHGSSNLASLEMGDDGIDMDGAKVFDMADGEDPQDAVTVSQLSTKINKNGENTFRKSGAGDIYGVDINYDDHGLASIAIVDLEADHNPVVRINTAGIYINPNYITTFSDNFLATVAKVASMIVAHDEDTFAHESIREDIEELTRAVNRIDDRGVSYGEVPYTTAQMTAFDSATRAANIKATIEAQSWWPVGTTYTPVNGHYVYDTGIGAGAQFHEWEYNGSAWVDNGESTNVPATNSTLGLVKGDGTYLDIINGVIDNKLSKKTLAIKDENSSAQFTFDQLDQAFTLLDEEQATQDDRLDIIEATQLTVPNITGGTAETPTQSTKVPSIAKATEIANTAVQAFTQMNQDEALSRFSPPLIGTVTNSTEVTDTAQGFHAHTYSLKGQTFVQLVKNGNFVNTANYTATSSTITASNNTLTLLASAQNGRFHQTFSTVNGNVYLLKIKVLTNRTNIRFHKGGTVIADSPTSVNSASYQELAYLFTASATESTNFGCLDNAASGWNAVLFKDFAIVNLTQQGNIPGTSTAWTTLTASQVAAYLGNYDTTAEIVAKAIAGGETNKVTNGEFTANYSGWTATNCGTPSVSNGVVSFTPTAQYGGLRQNTTSVVGRTYIVQVRMKTTDTSARINTLSLATTQIVPTADGEWHDYELISAVSSDASEEWRVISNATSGWSLIEVDYFRVYDITDYFPTSGIHSFTPELINVTDGVDTRNLVVATIGNLNSLPDGSRDVFENTIQADGERLMQITKKAHRLPLPYGTVGGNNIWSLRKVGTANTRFELKIENFWTAYTPDMDATRVWRNTLSTTAGDWEESGVQDNVFKLKAIISGIEDWATNVTPTILVSGTINAVAYDTLVANDSTLGLAVKEGYIYVNVGQNDTVTDLAEDLVTLGLQVVIPYDTYGTATNNVYSFPHTQVTFNAHCADTAGLTIYQDQDGQHFVSYKVANATADTLAELYTHLLANPITLVIPIVEAQFEHVISGYLTQYDESAFSVTSSTFVEPSAWELQYIKDLNKVIAAILAAIA